MKKILSIVSLALLMFVCVSCSKNTPEGVVTEYFSCVQKGQYEEAVDLLYFKNELPEKEKKQLANMFREKVSKEYDKKGGISSVVIDNVKMEEDGCAALINYTVKYGDGSAKGDAAKVIKVDGKWLLDSSK